MLCVSKLELGLSTSEFMQLTPRVFDAMTRHKAQLDKRADLRFGLIASILVSAHGGEPVAPGEFFDAELAAKKNRARKMLEIEKLKRSVERRETLRQMALEKKVNG